MCWCRSQFKLYGMDTDICQHSKTPKIINDLSIRTSITINIACDNELSKNCALTYPPLPQKNYSVSKSLLNKNIFLQRDDLMDDETWLQITYGDHNKNSPTEIILSYLIHTQSIGRSTTINKIKLPLSTMQCQHKNTLFDKYWLKIESKTLLLVDQMMFRQRPKIGHPAYRLYSLEHLNDRQVLRQIIAQGFY